MKAELATERRSNAELRDARQQSGMCKALFAGAPRVVHDGTGMCKASFVGAHRGGQDGSGQSTAGFPGDDALHDALRASILKPLFAGAPRGVQDDSWLSR